MKIKKKKGNKSSETGSNKERGSHFYGITFHSENTINISIYNCFETCIRDPGNIDYCDVEH